VRDGDDYVINGSKTFITNGTQADWMCMLANTGDGPVHRNKSLIIVPLKEGGKRAKGVTVARKLKKLGMHASDTAELYFEDVRVPVRNRIGDEGKGFVYQMKQFQEERMYAALGCITSCTRSIEETIEYTRNRKTFGKPIIENQVVLYRLCELLTEVEALRALTWKAVEIHVSGGDCTRFASMAKLKGTRLGREVHDACLQFWGGMGYMDETLVSRRYRDGRLGSIGGGADEVMLGIIAKQCGLLPDTRPAAASERTQT
jgi:citronellyl-CoA dehydrogenase